MWFSDVLVRGGGGGGRTRANFFLVGLKDPKISVLANVVGLIFWSHTKPQNKAKFSCKH